jgi:hypothetical protein
MTRLLLLAGALGLSAGPEVKLLRHPSYHQGKVAFSYLGDIWVAGENGAGVERLTVHRAATSTGGSRRTASGSPSPRTATATTMSS